MADYIANISDTLGLTNEVAGTVGPIYGYESAGLSDTVTVSAIGNDISDPSDNLGLSDSGTSNELVTGGTENIGLSDAGRAYTIEDTQHHDVGLSDTIYVRTPGLAQFVLDEAVGLSDAVIVNFETQQISYDNLVGEFLAEGNIRWELQSRLKDGTYIGALPYFNLQGEWLLSRPGNLRFQVPLHHPAVVSTPDLLTTGKVEIWAYRNDRLVFAGPLWDTTSSSSEDTISCTAHSLESYLDKRRIASTYQTSSAGYYPYTIIWGLLTASMGRSNGQLNLIRGAAIGPASTLMRARYDVAEGKYISDAIEDMVNSGLFDWSIEPQTRQLTIWINRKSVETAIRLAYGGTISNYSLQRMGTQMANSIFIQGPESYYRVVNDSSSQTEYNLYDYVESFTDARSPAHLLDYAYDTLDEKRTPPVNLLITTSDSQLINPWDHAITVTAPVQVNYGTVPEPAIMLGHNIEVEIVDGPNALEMDARVVGFQCTVDKTGAETFNWYINDGRMVS